MHESRKALKRTRALLCLVRPELKDADFRRENKRFRDISRALSLTRDRHVLLQTLSMLQVRHMRDAGEGFGIVRGLVAKELLDETTQYISTRINVAEIRQRLDEGRQMLKVLRVRRGDDEFDVVTEGLARSYRQGRNTFGDMFESGKEPHDEALHEWRKSVQLHWRHMALLRSAAPEICAERILRAQELSHALGWHNDLSVLETYCRTLPTCILSEEKYQPMSKLIKLEKRKALSNAKPVGHSLFAYRPKELRRTLAAHWSASATAFSTNTRS